MKKDKKQSIREMSDTELLKRIAQIEKDVVFAKMQWSTGSLKNIHEMKLLKKEMAFIKTLQTQRQQNEEK